MDVSAPFSSLGRKIHLKNRNKRLNILYSYWGKLAKWASLWFKGRSDEVMHKNANANSFMSKDGPTLNRRLNIISSRMQKYV